MIYYQTKRTSYYCYELKKAYEMLNSKFQLLEEYAIQYGLLFQKNILHKTIKNFELYNINEVYKFYKDYIFNSELNLDDYQIKTLDTLFSQLVDNRNYYVHEWFYDIFNFCGFRDNNNDFHYAEILTKERVLHLNYLCKRYDLWIDFFKTTFSLDSLPNYRKYSISNSTKSIDITQFDCPRIFYMDFFYTLKLYTYIENKLYTLFYYINKQKKCFDDEFIKNLGYMSLGEYGKALHMVTKDLNVRCAIDKYIINYDKFFKRILDLSVDRIYLVHGVFSKYYFNNESYDGNITDTDKNDAYKTHIAAQSFNEELIRILRQYKLDIKEEEVLEKSQD